MACCGNALAAPGDSRRHLVRLPRPGVAIPQLRQYVNRRRLRPAIGHRDPAEEVLRGCLGVFHCDVEIPMRKPLFAQRIKQFVLADILAATLVRAEQVLIRERRLRILVDHSGVGMGGQVVGVEPVVLDVLTVVALLVGQPIGPFLEELVVAVPQRDTHADDLVAVAPAGQTVLVPPIRAASGMFEREVRPRIAVGAVVLTDRAPSPLTQVGAPPPPIRGPCPDLIEAILFSATHAAVVTIPFRCGRRTRYASPRAPWR